MDIHEFKAEFIKQVCFSSHTVFAWRPKFDKNNLTRWTKKGYIIKLKNGIYSFPEYIDKPNFTFYAANCIYRPSYISTEAALAFYGLIPEAVVQITNVSTLKTKSFENVLGRFTYQTLATRLFFGYLKKPLFSGLHILMARPEKAILDLLYLKPFYNSASDLDELRLDPDVAGGIIDPETLLLYARRFDNKRIDFLSNTFAESVKL